MHSGCSLRAHVARHAGAAGDAVHTGCNTCDPAHGTVPPTLAAKDVSIYSDG